MEEEFTPCSICKLPIGKQGVDLSFRKGDTDEIVAWTVCRECDQDIYDEAISQIGD